MQRAHGNALIGANGFVVKYAAHMLLLLPLLLMINNKLNSLNGCSKKYKYNDITIQISIQIPITNINNDTINAAHSGTILRGAPKRGVLPTGAHRRVEPAHARPQRSVGAAAAPNVRAPGTYQIRGHAHFRPAQRSHRAARNLSRVQPGTRVQPWQRGGPVVRLRHGGQCGIHAAQPVFRAAEMRAVRIRAVVQERPLQRAH